MRDTREIMAELASTGLLPDQLALIVELTAAVASRTSPDLSKGVVRTRRWREKKASQSVTVTSHVTLDDDRHKASQTVTGDDSDVTCDGALIYNKKEKKVRARKKTSGPIPSDWQPSLSHHSAAQKLNLPSGRVESKAEDMRLWARSTGTLKADWDATFHGFLRREAEGRQPANPNPMSAIL